MRWAIVFGVGAVAGSLFGQNDSKKPPQKEPIPLLPQGWISEEALLWKTSADRFAYGNRSEPLGSSSYTDRSLDEPHAEWNPGIRITGGYQYKDWAFFASWTYLQNKATGHKSTNGTKGFFPVLSLAPGLQPQDYVTAASMNWRLNFHCVDLGVAYPWKPGKVLHLQPSLALRLAFLDQRAVVNYGGGLFSGGMDRILLKNDFWGIGPALGVMPSIHLSMGFSLVGDVAVSLLGGRLFTKDHESYLSQTLFLERANKSRFCGSFDAKVGVNWETHPLYHALVMSFQLGWEWHTFYELTRLGQNQFGFFRTPYNVAMQGAYLSAAVGF